MKRKKHSIFSSEFKLNNDRYPITTEEGFLLKMGPPRYGRGFTAFRKDRPSYILSRSSGYKENKQLVGLFLHRPFLHRSEDLDVPERDGVHYNSQNERSVTFDVSDALFLTDLRHGGNNDLSIFSNYKGGMMFKRIYLAFLSLFTRDIWMDTIYNLPYMDPDSMRFIEKIWATRARKKLVTKADYYDINHVYGATHADAVEYVRRFLTPTYISPRVIRAMEKHQKFNIVDFYIVVEISFDGDIRLNAFGDVDKVTDFLETAKTFWQTPNSMVLKTLTSIERAVSYRTDVLQFDTIEKANDEFYPWLTEGVDAFINNYKNDKSAALLLIGPRGMGKSTLMRSLAVKMGMDKNFLVIDENLLAHPNISGWISALPNNVLLCIEDADNFIKSREDGNRQMSSLLNVLNGIVSKNVKVVISTNLNSLNKVEGALVREGRTFRVLEFKLLTTEQAHVARASNGLPVIDLPDRNWTLSEALNFSTLDNIQERKATSVGFINN